jgi:hypothetical protein
VLLPLFTSVSFCFYTGGALALRNRPNRTSLKNCYNMYTLCAFVTCQAPRRVARQQTAPRSICLLLLSAGPGTGRNSHSHSSSLCRSLCNYTVRLMRQRFHLPTRIFSYWMARHRTLWTHTAQAPYCIVRIRVYLYGAHLSSPHLAWGYHNLL